MRGLSASTAHAAGDRGGGAPAEPFISGNFEYGFGRMAARRKVALLTPCQPWHLSFSDQAHVVLLCFKCYALAL
jgi:hypothetical protein